MLYLGICILHSINTFELSKSPFFTLLLSSPLSTAAPRAQQPPPAAPQHSRIEVCIPRQYALPGSTAGPTFPAQRTPAQRALAPPSTSSEYPRHFGLWQWQSMSRESVRFYLTEQEERKKEGGRRRRSQTHPFQCSQRAPHVRAHPAPYGHITNL